MYLNSTNIFTLMYYLSSPIGPSMSPSRLRHLAMSNNIFFSWCNLLKFEGLLDFVHLLLFKNIAKMIYVEAEKKQRKSFIDKIEIKKVYCFFTVVHFKFPQD